MVDLVFGEHLRRRIDVDVHALEGEARIKGGVEEREEFLDLRRPPEDWGKPYRGEIGKFERSLFGEQGGGLLRGSFEVTQHQFSGVLHDRISNLRAAVSAASRTWRPAAIETIRPEASALTPWDDRFVLRRR